MASEDAAGESGGGSPPWSWEWRRDRRAVVCAPALADALGLDPDDRSLSYRGFLKAVHPGDRGRVVGAIRRARRSGGGFRLHCRYRRPDGAEIILYQEAAEAERESRTDGRITGFARDLTGQIRDRDRIRRLALFDDLTGLPNRVFLQEFLNRAMAAARRRRTCLAVLFVAADDADGREVDNALLKEAGRRLASSVRVKCRADVDDEREPTPAAVVPGDMAARVGAAEFAVVLPEIGRIDDAIQVARRILEALSRPFRLDGIDVALSARIGVSLFPWHGRDAAVLIDRAEAAMDRAETDALRCRVSDPHVEPVDAFGRGAMTARGSGADPAAIAALPAGGLSHWEMTAL